MHLSTPADTARWPKITTQNPANMKVIMVERDCYLCLQYFDAVGWAAGRASGL